MVKQRLKKLLGQVIKISSIIVGLYLILVTFGYEPLRKIIEIANQEQGWRFLGKTFVQLLKMMFGMGYSFIGMAILYRFGTRLVDKSEKK